MLELCQAEGDRIIEKHKVKNNLDYFSNIHTYWLTGNRKKKSCSTIYLSPTLNWINLNKIRLMVILTFSGNFQWYAFKILYSNIIRGVTGFFPGESTAWA